MALFIGFTTKFYTLWDVTTEVITTQFDKYTQQHCAYIKNISFDLEEAKRAYPEAEIDLSLRGHSTIIRGQKRERINQDLFQYGRYQGTKIADCTDYPYIYWYVTNGGLTDDNRYACLEVLLNNGYELVNDCHILTPELVAERNAWLEDIENAELSIMQNGYVDLTLTSNARWDRESEDYPYSLDTDIKGLTIAVNEAKEMYYSGHTYYLPIVKGKAKKLKNKRVRVYADKYEVGDIGIWRTFAVLATNIEVLK